MTASPRPARLGVIGVGQRGADVYGRWVLMHPEEARIVAAADLDPVRLGTFGDEHAIPHERRYLAWDALLERGSDLDGVIVATPDRAHLAPLRAAAARSLPVLVEKPVITDSRDLPELVALAATADVTVAHPLRYSPLFRRISDLRAAGALGRLVGIDLVEQVGWWHYAHSYVRGSWRRSDLASPMILAKSSHDLDLLRWLADAPAERVWSTAAARHFTPYGAPGAVPERCTDGCPVAQSCPFDAPSLYLSIPTGEWPRSVVSPGSDEAVVEALRSGPYGRCVYRADNDVIEHQTVSIEFANGLTATLTTSAFTTEVTRSIRLFGTAGEIRGHLGQGRLETAGFGPGRRVETTVEELPAEDGHDIADDELMVSFTSRIRRRRAQGGGAELEPRTSLDVALDSHRMAFAAEESRRRGIPVDPRVIGLPNP